MVPSWMPCRGLVVVAALVVDMAVVLALLVLLITMHLTLTLTCLLCATTGVLCFCVQKTADFLQFQYVDKVVDILFNSVGGPAR